MKKSAKSFWLSNLEVAFVNRTDIYRQAVKRTFAELLAFHPARWMLDTAQREAVMAANSTVLIALVILIGATVPSFAEEELKQPFHLHRQNV